jgi:hypothetical protein
MLWAADDGHFLRRESAARREEVSRIFFGEKSEVGISHAKTRLLVPHDRGRNPSALSIESDWLRSGDLPARGRSEPTVRALIRWDSLVSARLLLRLTRPVRRPTICMRAVVLGGETGLCALNVIVTAAAPYKLANPASSCATDPTSQTRVRMCKF